MLRMKIRIAVLLFFSLTLCSFGQDVRNVSDPVGPLPAWVKAENTITGSTVYKVKDLVPLYQEELTQYWKANAWKDSVKNITTADTVAKEFVIISQVKTPAGFTNSSKLVIKYRSIANNQIYFSEMSNYQWTPSTSTWTLAGKNTWTYDGNGFLTQLKAEMMLVPPTMLVIQLETYTNNVLGHPTLVLRQALDFSSMQLINDRRFTNTYAANNIDMLTELEARWVKAASVFRDTARTTYTYNSHHDPLTKEETILINNGASSQKNSLHEYTYDANFNQTQVVYKYWNNNSSAYINSSRETMTYSATNKELTYLRETYSGNAWVPDSRYTNTYLPSGDISKTLDEDYVNNTWVNYSQDLYSYVPTGIDENQAAVSDFVLFNNYPNPFNPTTNISYRLSGNLPVSLKVFDILGNEAATLVNEVQGAGLHEVAFDASSLASGTYIYRLQAGTASISKKLTLIK